MKDIYDVSIMSWNDEVEEGLKNYNPELASLLKSGIKRSDLFLRASYHFSEYIVKNGELYLPGLQKNSILYQGKQASKNLQKFVGDVGNWPLFGIVVGGSAEQYLQGSERLIMRGKTCPGEPLWLRRLFEHDRIDLFFREKWNIAAGSRTLALLPSIKNATKHRMFQSKFGIQTEKPQGFSGHAELLRGLYLNTDIDWKTDVIFFSQELVKRIKENDQFSELRNSCLAKLWFSNHEHYYPFFDFFWDEFIRWIESRGIREKTYIYNLARHLILVALGMEFAFAPITSDDCGPVKDFIDFFQHIYKLEYNPNFIAAKTLSDDQGDAVYYSLQYPINLNPYPSKNSGASGLDDVRSIQNLHEKFFEFITDGSHGFSENPTIAKIPKTVKFQYFHTVKDGLKRIEPSKLVEDVDKRFEVGFEQSSKPFCYSSAFFKGCIRVERI